MLKSSLKQFLIYSIGSVSQTALGFVLLPLYLRQLTTAEYGIVNVLLTLNSAIGLVAGAGLLSGISRLYYDQLAPTQKAMAGTVLIWIGGISLALALGLWLGAEPVSSVLFGAPQYVIEVRAAGLLLFTSAVQASLYIVLRLEKRATQFVAISIIGFLTDLLLKVYLIGVAHYGVQGYLVSSAISTTLTLVLAGFVLRRNVALQLKPELLRALLQLGFPFIFTGFGMWVLDISDRLILNAFAGPASVGVYALAYKFASIFNIFLLGPLSLFWTPFIFSYGADHGEDAMRRVCGQALTLFALIGSVALVGISAGSYDLIRLFTHNPAYYQAHLVIPFLSLAPFLYLLSYPAGSAILQSKQVRYSSFAMLIAAAVNVGLNLILVPLFSLYGATATTVIGYAVLVGLQYFWAQRVFPVPYEWRCLAKLLGSAAVSVAIVFQVHLDSALLSIVVREATGLACFGLLAALTGGIRLAEAQRLYQLAIHLLPKPASEKGPVN
jgi:O-antigen/teichoic acid export membrane protein